MGQGLILLPAHLSQRGIGFGWCLFFFSCKRHAKPYACGCTRHRGQAKRVQRDAAKREALRELIGYVQKRLSMMAYRDLIDADLVIASGIVEGAARYLVGERLDCSGMRWIPERAEAFFHLRCIELNGAWERFFTWSYQRWLERMRSGHRVVLRTKQADILPTEASMEETETLFPQQDNMTVAAQRRGVYETICTRPKRGRKRLFNQTIHDLRDRAERTFAWEDKFMRLLLRFEHLQRRHYAMKLMAYTLINLRRFCAT